MDLTTMIVVIGLTALSFGAIVWLNIYSRRSQPKMSDEEASADEAQSGVS